jgi:DHA1 family multidrug resistance protein-like MFS transporter
MKILLKNRGAFLVLMFNLFLVFTGIGLIVPIMPTYMNQLGISGSMVGLLVGLFSLTEFLFSPAIGRLTDSAGRKRMIVAGMLLFAVSEVLFGLAEAWWLLALSRMLGGLSAAMIMPAVMAYAADITTEEERATGMGYMSAAITTGFVIGPGIGGYLAELGIRVPFFAAGAAGLVAAIITWAVLRESRPIAAAGAGAGALPQPGGAEKLGLLSQLKHSYHEPYFFSLIIIFVMSFGLANFETVFGLFVDHKFGFDAQDIAAIITFGSISGAVIQLTAFGWILRTFGERRVISVCLLVAGGFILLTLFMHRYFLIFAVTFIVFLATDILRPAVSTQMSMLAKDSQGYVAGLNSAFTSLGNIIGPIVAGVLFDLNLNFPYILASLVLLACFGLSLRSRRLSRAVPETTSALSTD